MIDPADEIEQTTKTDASKTSPPTAATSQVDSPATTPPNGDASSSRPKEPCDD